MSKPHEAFPDGQDRFETPEAENKGVVDETTTTRKTWVRPMPMYTGAITSTDQAIVQEPNALSWKSTAPLCILLVLIAIALEVMLYASHKNGGMQSQRPSFVATPRLTHVILGIISVSFETSRVKQFLKVIWLTLSSQQNSHAISSLSSPHSSSFPSSRGFDQHT